MFIFGGWMYRNLCLSVNLDWIFWLRSIKWIFMVINRGPFIFYKWASVVNPSNPMSTVGGLSRDSKFTVHDCIGIFLRHFQRHYQKNVINEIICLKRDIKQTFQIYFPFFETKRKIWTWKEKKHSRNILVVLKYIGIRMFNPEPL